VLIGVPKEIKNHEYRVGVTPGGTRSLVAAGHDVLVQGGAGLRIGFSDEMYRAVGARIAASAAEIYACPLVVKVKEPQPAELPLLHEGQALFTYFHLAAAPELTARLLERKIVAIAYETVSEARDTLPLLTPMSEVAGRIAIQAGATALQMANGGNGTLLGGVPGVAPARVVVLGGGTVGTQAARMALGAGADVTILDINLNRLRYLDDVFGARLKTRYSEMHALEELVLGADLVVGAVLIPGKRAPKLLSRQLIQSIRPGGVLVDVAIDQGGCAETSRPTTHSEPTYVEEGVVHYCVTNMPAACARTSTQALTNATLPYVLQLAGLGWRQALRDNAGLCAGLNLCLGEVVHPRVADDLGYAYCAPQKAMSM
jgi:alanine dehydrogenase